MEFTWYYIFHSNLLPQASNARAPLASKSATGLSLPPWMGREQLQILSLYNLHINEIIIFLIWTLLLFIWFLVPHAIVGHAMPLPTPRSYRRRTVCSPSARDPARTALGLMGHRVFSPEAFDSSLQGRHGWHVFYLYIWSPVSPSQIKTTSSHQNKKWFDNYQTTWHAMRSPTSYPVWKRWWTNLPQSFWSSHPCPWYPLNFSSSSSSSWVSPLPLRGHLWGHPARKWWVSLTPHGWVSLARACGDSRPGSPSGNAK